MTIDPTPFLSTVVLASVALVAIVGGLLVARFVSLDSDQRGSRKVLTDAVERLEVARDRARTARQRLLRREASGFFRDPDVIEAVVDRGVTSTDELMRIARWDYAPGELAPFAAEVAEEAVRARETLPGLVRRSELTWDQFSRNHPDLPEIRWPRAWERVYDGIAQVIAQAEAKRQREAERSMSPAERMMAQISRPPSFIYDLAPPATDYRATAERRYDEMLASHAQAKQQVEDYEGELARLRLAHAEIVRPDARLWWGAIILIVLTILGVVVPLSVMATGPRDLTPVRWVLYPFIASLALLIGYIVWYLTQLTRSKQDRPDAKNTSRAA